MSILRFFLSLKCNERLVGNILLGCFFSFASSLADRIRVSLFLEHARKLFCKVAILQASHFVLDWTWQHLPTLVGGFIKGNLNFINIDDKN